MRIEINFYKMIEDIIKQAVRWRINPQEAVERIDETFAGIHTVNYRVGFTINGESVKRKGLSERQLEVLGEIAALAYRQAQRNGIREPGEVHLGSRASTKHHREGFDSYVEKLEEKYGGVLV